MDRDYQKNCFQKALNRTNSCISVRYKFIYGKNAGIPDREKVSRQCETVDNRRKIFPSVTPSVPLRLAPAKSAARIPERSKTSCWFRYLRSD